MYDEESTCCSHCSDRIDWLFGATWSLGALLRLSVAIQGYDLDKRVQLYEELLMDAGEEQNVPEEMNHGVHYTLSLVLFDEQERKTIFGESVM